MRARRFGLRRSGSACPLPRRFGSISGSGRGHGKIGGHRPRVLVGEAGDWLLARLAETPDLTIRALTAELAARGLTVAHDTVWRFVRRAGQTVKKSP